MKEKDIVVGEYYAVALGPYDAEKLAKRGQVIKALGKSKWLVRFRDPMIDEGWRLVINKVRGVREIEVDNRRFRSSWEKHGEKRRQKAQEKDTLEHSLIDLKELLASKGIKLQSHERIRVMESWSRREPTPVAQITLSGPALMVLLGALTNPDDGVVSQLLEEK